MKAPARASISWVQLVHVLALALALMLVPQAAAAAELHPAPAAPLPMAEGDPEPTANWGSRFFGFIDITDSNGIGINTYALSLDEGGILSPTQAFWAAQAQSAWSAYRTLVAIALWVLDWVLSGDWITVVSTPLVTVGATLQDMIDRTGLVPLFLTLTALICLLGLYFGRAAARLWDLGVALVIAGLLTTALATPVAFIAGEDGLVAKTFAASQEISMSAVTRSEEVPPDQAGQIAQMVDVLIAMPARTINFGAPDLGECESVYVDALRQASRGAEDKIRLAVADCNDELGDYAASPGVDMVVDAGGVYVGAAAVFLLVLILGGRVLYHGIVAMAESIKLLFTLLTGLLPGVARGPIAASIASIIVDLGLVFFSTLFLAILMEILRVTVVEAPPELQSQRMLLFAIFTIVGVVVYVRHRKKFSASRSTLASWLRWSPQGGPRATQVPQERDLLADASRVSMLLNTLYNRRTAQHVATPARRQLAERTDGAIDVGPTRLTVVPTRATPIGPERQLAATTTPPATYRQPPAPQRRQITPPPTPPPTPPQAPTGPGPAPTGPGPAPSRGPRPGGRTVETLTPVIVRVGANAAAAAATGGASTAARFGMAGYRVSRAAGTARRALLTKRLGGTR